MSCYRRRIASGIAGIIDRHLDRLHPIFIRGGYAAIFAGMYVELVVRAAIWAASVIGGVRK
jgi:hypothetical protein